ncbi:hypothetical protein LTR36_005827 [Oleoguttula mirabilis]|uniref:Uncharacterized protein n=1 Tax=Oleoguttula mirabilis TaxID=1507867 RepID=A0AAV9JE10_9PEZI|nr:hypothetical protein LTR36_005827 [Oleoguttula mirabilis]
MADQASQVTSKAPKAPGPAGGLQDQVQGVTTGILSSVEGWGGWVAAKGKAIVDRIFPPEQRASLLAKVQAFMLRNPKISAFLGMNLALTGIPLGLFALFTVTVALFSLIVGLLLGLLAAVVFIVFAVGIALMMVLPAVFFTTMAACFLFLWGLGGYYILKWANGDSGAKDKDGQPSQGGAIGDKLNSLTGGRLTGFMDAAKKERSKGDISGYGDQYTKPDAGGGQEKKPQSNGTAHKNAAHGAQKEVGDAAHKATKATGVDGAHKTAANATGTVKGGLSGATGLG